MRVRRTRLRLLAALMAGVMVLTTGGFTSLEAFAATRNDPRKERDEVRRRKAELASQVDVLKGSQDEVTAALDALNANVTGQQAAFESARRAAEQAARDATRAKAEAAAAAEQLTVMRDTVRRAAIQAYVTPAGNDPVTATLSSDDVNVAVRRKALLEFGTGRSADAIDKLRAAQEDLALKSAGAEEAAQRAADKQASVESQLRQLEGAREQQRQLATQVNDRINHALSEAAHPLIEQHHVDLVVLARYMRILSTDFCAHLPARIINIHHSFLPSFKGGRPYHQAHERGVKLIGATAHYVTAELDEGPIIEQEVSRVDHGMEPEELAAVGRDLEAIALARAVRWHVEHRILLNGTKTVVFA